MLWGTGTGALLCAIASAGLLSACAEGETKTVTETTVVQSAADTRAPDPAPADPGPTEEEAGELVNRFYQLIDRYQYRDAWVYMPPAIKREAGGFGEWKEGYRHNYRTEATVDAYEPEHGEVQVEVEIEATDYDACTSKRVEQTFAGHWTLVEHGDEWEPVALDIAKTGGGTPTLVESECAYGGGGSGYRGGTSPDGGGGGDGSGGGGNGYDYNPSEAYDLDCDDFSGPQYVGRNDPNGLDADGDGVGCE